MARKWLGSADVEVSSGGALSVYGLYPVGEQDIVPIVLNDNNNHPLALPANAVAILVRCDGDFVEGQAQPSAGNNLLRDKDTIHSIPVAGRATWNFRRGLAAQGSNTTLTLKGKILVAG